MAKDIKRYEFENYVEAAYSTHVTSLENLKFLASKEKNLSEEDKAFVEEALKYKIENPEYKFFKAQCFIKFYLGRSNRSKLYLSEAERYDKLNKCKSLEEYKSLNATILLEMESSLPKAKKSWLETLQDCISKNVLSEKMCADLKVPLEFKEELKDYKNYSRHLRRSRLAKI
jgi:hypothetical protein